MKIVLKVSLVCKKCKSCILQIVSKIKGIKSLAYDDEKSTLTVVGDVDVVAIVGKLRKAKFPAAVVTVGDEKKEAEEKKKKEEEEKKKKEKEAEEKMWKQCAELQQCCKACRPYYIDVDNHPASYCTIM